MIFLLGTGGVELWGKPPMASRDWGLSGLEKAWGQLLLPLLYTGRRGEPQQPAASHWLLVHQGPGTLASPICDLMGESTHALMRFSYCPLNLVPPGFYTRALGWRGVVL